jgi:transcriptional regulator with XRE-family HTH domain
MQRDSTIRWAREIGKRIAVMRRAKGWDQERLAKELGVSRQTVSQHETGSVLTLQLRGVEKLTKLLDVSSRWLIFGDQEVESDLDPIAIKAEAK